MSQTMSVPVQHPSYRRWDHIYIDGQWVTSASSDTIEEGAKLIVGGLGAPEGLDQGFSVRPTVFSEVEADMAIGQEEIFGPGLSILAYDDAATAIANGVIYGLLGAVWGEDPQRALAVARLLRTGQVEVNGGAMNLTAPLGGYKQSGLGRENGVMGFEEFLESKSVQI